MHLRFALHCVQREGRSALSLTWRAHVERVQELDAIAEVEVVGALDDLEARPFAESASERPHTRLEIDQYVFARGQDQRRDVIR